MKDRARITVRVDWYTRICLTVIAVLLTVVIAGLWADGVQLAPTARADDKVMFDSTADRKAMIAEQQSTNAKLDELIKVLRSGEGKFQVVDSPAASDKKGQGARGKDDNSNAK
jgi:hypothetical protein